MTFLSALYTLIISPLELLFEVIFSIADRIIGNAGLAIIFLSLAVNFLVLPLYKRADELQAEERDIQVRMASRIKQIKSTFKGDERFFMLQEYYRINHYKPVYALKSSVSILLQIPFFIAAYNLLSGMTSLQGMPFGFISDLGKEDAAFMIGSFPVNALPILMTLINIVSGMIYTKGHPLKEKIQVYGLAAVFLVLLYHSPSGLVFYWMLNNVFSLVKNIFYKLKDPKKKLSIVLALAGAAVIVFTLIRTDLDARQKVLLSIAAVLLVSPLIMLKREKMFNSVPAKNTSIFFAGTVFMAVFTGVLIPSSVINASPVEFIDVIHVTNPLLYVINAMLLSFGSWVLWGGIFYFLMSERVKSLFCTAICFISTVAVIDYLLFGVKNNNLSSTLQYDHPVNFLITEYLVNALTIVVIILICILIYIKAAKILKSALIVGIITFLTMSISNTAGILAYYNIYIDKNGSSTVSSDLPTISLSKYGKNVVVIMLDRALGTQVPYIFNEKPELKKKFDGFTYYPNTISFGPGTIIASPALYGGYEYTPEKINERTNETLVDKQNEALKIMPVLFGENGYSVTIFDPSLAGYRWLPDLSIYDDYPSFNCYNLSGRFNFFETDVGISSANMSDCINSIRNRNLYMFSLMRVSPLLFQETIYDGGLYNEAGDGTSNNANSIHIPSFVQKITNMSSANGFDKDFIDAFATLHKLPELTSISNDSRDNFIMMSNEATHFPCLLQKPDYLPSQVVDNTPYDNYSSSVYTINGVSMKMNNIEHIRHYHVNVASYIKLGEWFDYLRTNGVYDNTRIILVSDHGQDLDQFDIKCNGVSMEYFMPLLMVKDFNAKGFTVNNNFMTNADTPTLATSGLINDPINPFTGIRINSDDKNRPQTVYIKLQLNPAKLFNKTSFPDLDGYVLTGNNPHIADNWKFKGQE